MKSFGLFASGADNSRDGSKQKKSELVAQSRNKRKRDGKLDCFILCISYSKTTLLFYFDCFRKFLSVARYP